MIGTILIAVIGYGLALHYVFATSAALYVELTDDDANSLRRVILRNGITALGFAAVTRWLIGGAF